MHHLIEEVYNSVESNDQELLLGYLERYALSSDDKKSYKFLQKVNKEKNVKSEVDEKEDFDKGILSIKPINTVSALASTYSGTTAASWAYNNYNKYSTDFPAFTEWGSDCTNFVSQAMYHGGMAMGGDWYIYKKNDKYLVPKSATELDYSWDLADPSPWISVEQFRKYWDGRSVVNSFSRDYYESNHTTIYSSSIYKGDVVVFHQGVAGWITTPTHLMIISGYDTANRDFELAGHSNERRDLPLLDAIDVSGGNYDYFEIFELPSSN
ncbi:amidase domain-containing protein [Chengkuizengella axinellae]|uniref:Amidase domain-containing protein n=1 Tax=Chengkuizengella axinellae TaxID=3064388 RepID=A0ABT9J6E3_9BACL|nr:amidase domain-containing protein [Chengkuizengella sp. 2205SS18-9]MDP5277174.1 amidase domain-containing protein [Chengkuizengella sp. 2205SS18-9]